MIEIDNGILIHPNHIVKAVISGGMVRLTLINGEVVKVAKNWTTGVMDVLARSIINATP